MEIESDAKSQTRSARAVQSQTNVRRSDQRSQRGIESPSKQHGDISQRTNRTSGERGITGEPDPIIGGIIRALREQVEARLSETRDCIEWYRKEEQKCLNRLEELKQLEALSREQDD